MIMLSCVNRQAAAWKRSRLNLAVRRWVAVPRVLLHKV